MIEFSIPPVSRLPAAIAPTGRKRVVMVAIPGANALELIGPMEVLTEANYFLELSGRDDLGYDVEVVTTVPGAVFKVKGMQMTVDTAYHEISGPVDTVVIQSIDYEGNCLEDERFLEWIEAVAQSARRVATVCIGTYVLAAAGVLDGRRAATHWAAIDDFKKRFPKVKLDPDPIFVKDDNLFTSAGVTSGLDLMLALIEEDFGAELALRVAQDMVLFLRRPGSQSQFSVYVSGKLPEEDRIKKIQAYIAEHLKDDLGIEVLAENAGMSARNFTRVFTRQVGISPGKFVERSRLEHARRSLEESPLALKQIANESGYGTTDSMRIAFDRHLGVPPGEYRRRFSSSAAPVA